MTTWLRTLRNLGITATAVTAAGVLYRQRAERLMSLRGQTVLVTGAGSGIGRGLAISAAQRGAGHVVVWDVVEQAASAVVDEIHAAGGRASYDVVDLGSDDSVDAAGQAVRQRLGGIDFLINNAGVVSGKYFLEQRHDDVARTFQINALALYRVTRQFLPGMIAKDFGSVTVIVSAASLTGVARQTDYAASKWAAHGFVESLRAELRHNGQRVHTLSVHPFYVATGMFQGASSPNPLLPILEPEVVVEKTLRAIEAGRQQLVLPAAATVATWLKILPTRTAGRIQDLFGINSTMDAFQGRR